MNKLIISGAVLVLMGAGCTGATKTNTEPEEEIGQNMEEAMDTEETMVYTSESWVEIIPASCTSFSDGCNTCNRADVSDAVACTKMACAEYKRPVCLDESTEYEDMMEGGTVRKRVEVLKSNKQGDPDANKYDFGDDSMAPSCEGTDCDVAEDSMMEETTDSADALDADDDGDSLGDTEETGDDTDATKATDYNSSRSNRTTS